MQGDESTCAPEEIVTGGKSKQVYTFQPRIYVSLLSARKSGWSSKNGMLFVLSLWV